MVDWYLLFNLEEFEDAELVSRNLTLTLTDIGEKEILITKGNHVAIYYEDTFLPINFLDHNPYARDGRAVYLDEQGEVWLGIEVED
jgi:hypothetical protein